MDNYEFLTANELTEVLGYLAQLDKVKLLAGGTDLMVDMRKKVSRLSNFNYLLDITKIDSLKNIVKRDRFIEIGSLVTHTNLIENPLIRDKFPVLIEAAKTIGSTQIRNRGTIGGNICNASPAADLLPPLLAYNALLILEAEDSTREVSLSDFLKGPYRTDLRDKEILTKVKIPLLKGSYLGSFQKIGRRRALSIARLNLAVIVRLEEGLLSDARIVPGAATPYPRAFPTLEEAVNGQQLADLDLDRLGEIAAQEMISFSGERWSTPYKMKAIAALVKKAFSKLMKEGV